MTPTWMSIRNWPNPPAPASIPLVQVGGELKYPQSISIYWAEEELKSLGVGPFAVVQGGD